MDAHVFSSSVIGYPERSAVNFADRETRRRLSPSAIRVFTNIADKMEPQRKSSPQLAWRHCLIHASSMEVEP